MPTIRERVFIREAEQDGTKVYEVVNDGNVVFISDDIEDARCVRSQDRSALKYPQYFRSFSKIVGE